MNSTSQQLCVTFCSVTARDITFEDTKSSKWQSRNHCSNATQFLKEEHFQYWQYFEEEKKSNALVFWYSLFIEKYGLNDGNSLRMTEQEDISSCYFTIEETWSRYISYVAHASLYIYRTSILSFGGCLQEPKPILRYVLDKCLNVWINEEWENLEL